MKKLILLIFLVGCTEQPYRPKFGVGEEARLKITGKVVMIHSPASYPGDLALIHYTDDFGVLLTCFVKEAELLKIDNKSPLQGR